MRHLEVWPYYGQTSRWRFIISISAPGSGYLGIWALDLIYVELRRNSQDPLLRARLRAELAGAISANDIQWYVNDMPFMLLILF